MRVRVRVGVRVWVWVRVTHHDEVGPAAICLGSVAWARDASISTDETPKTVRGVGAL